MCFTNALSSGKKNFTHVLYIVRSATDRTFSRLLITTSHTSDAKEMATYYGPQLLISGDRLIAYGAPKLGIFFLLFSVTIYPTLIDLLFRLSLSTRYIAAQKLWLIALVNTDYIDAYMIVPLQIHLMATSRLWIFSPMMLGVIIAALNL